ncbi:E3 ubiquitin-protein ligase Zswim2 [Cladorrhinum sp. PSN332]|nr:E3 ubiquitin-protein ligase Zswim2 [Cladorrhinum sp. PSN332]
MGVPTDPSYGATSSSSGTKRKQAPPVLSHDYEVEDAYSYASSSTPTKKARTAKSQTEKRLRRFRTSAPQAFDEVYQRALTQRFYVLSRTRSDHALEELVELTGSTGNIYTVTITHQPTCTCPHSAKGHQCKHQLYVLSRVLHAKYEYIYQLALLSSELEEIFAAAPPPDSEDGGEADKDGRRKPLEGGCPICFCEMEEQREQIVWCRAACGQNIHKGCFEMWAETKRKQSANAEVTCPYCRSVWQGDEDMVTKIKRNGKKNSEGYVNVADQLGVSTQRDHSSYSRWWSGHYNSHSGRHY